MIYTTYPGGLLALPLTFLLTTFVPPVTAAQGADSEAAAPVLAVQRTAEERDFHDAIQQMESSEGAYAGGLSESLFSLAQKLQSEGRHGEAIEAFRRGVHLARINEGLYCTQQIPLLQGEIASQKAAKNYAAADERQNYLYRVQTRSLASSEALADAYMQQAKWQYDAFQLRLNEEGHVRLMEMADQYRLAAQDVIAREGTASPNLLPPLHGMLQAQYLISRYDMPVEQPVFMQDQDIPRIDESVQRFRSYREQSFQQGNEIIQAIAGVENDRATVDGTAIARAQVMLGDWRLWNGKITSALEAYREAETAFARSGDGQAEMQRLFAQPVALPDFAESGSLPPAAGEAEQADVTLTFGVSEMGRVQDIEWMDENEELDGQAYRLMRQLRRTTFRPRFEAGQPVETQNVVKAFDIQ